MNRTSAVRAARAAITGAQNAGRMDSYVQAERKKITGKRQWVATLDNCTRHAHRILDGQEVRGEKTPFKVDGEEIMFPGDPSAAGYLVYNCRCTLIAAVEGVDTSDAKRRAKDPETGESVVIEDMTYQEWETWRKSVDKQRDKADTRITGIQFFARKSEDFPTIWLSKKEYAHVMSELATHLIEEQQGKKVVKKAIGKCIYTVENNGFGNYRIIGKIKIPDGIPERVKKL